MKLMMSGHDVQTGQDGNLSEFYVKFHGPKDTPYENGVWKVHVDLPLNYPYKSPSIGFMNRIFHPNVDEGSGSVCLDVINQSWSPMFDLLNVFDVFLPQLLSYPNPTDPLNGEAASLSIRSQEAYKQTIREYVSKYASITAYEQCERQLMGKGLVQVESDDDASSLGGDDDLDDEVDVDL